MFNTFILLFISLNTINSAELKITKNNDGMFINLFELIEERKQSMFESESINSIKSNAVIIMGPTGSGKTTLVRYLNGEELINLKVDNKWIIEKKQYY